MLKLRIFASEPQFGREGRREEGREREKKGKHSYERHIKWLPLAHAPQGPGIEPATRLLAFDWKSNMRPFGVWADSLTTKQHWPGGVYIF